MIDRGLVWRLGFGQLVCWGVTYYLVGVFGPRMAVDLGWSLTSVQAGFAFGLLTMGLVSPIVGRLIERSGGRRAMTAGSLIGALGCAALAVSHTMPAYYASWVVIGVAMRLSLYDAAFAALARIGGAEAKRAMAQITLLGGLASTVFWPVGDHLATAFGWRAATLVYAMLSALTALLHRSIPEGRFAEVTSTVPAEAAEDEVPKGLSPRDQRAAAVLYAIAVALGGALNAAMSSHMIAILAGLGLGLQAAVWTSALRGFGQTIARGCEVLFGASLRPANLNLIAAFLLPIAFAIGLWSAVSPVAAAAFALMFGAGNGLSTITRGTLPLAFFEPAVYGSLVGRLIAPSFLLQAAAPLAFAFAIDRFGAGAALWLSIVLGAATLAAAVGLKLLDLRR